MASLTVLRSTLSNDLLRDPNNRIRSIDTIDRSINVAYQKMQQDLLDMYEDGEQDTTITTSSGVVWYTLPSDFLKIKIVTNNTQPLVRTTRKELQSQWYDLTTLWQPQQYYLYQWELRLYPVPDSAYTISVDYTWLLPTITTVQDSLNPSYLDRALCYLSASECYKIVMRVDQAQVWESEYEKAKNSAMLFMIADENLNFY